MTKSMFLRSPVLAAVALLGIVAASRPASAAVFTDTITNVQLSNGAGGLILSTTSNNFVQAILTQVPNCTGSTALAATTADTMKAWTSMAQSAMLAGKTVQITTQNCSNGGIYITTMSINK